MFKNLKILSKNKLIFNTKENVYKYGVLYTQNIF